MKKIQRHDRLEVKKPPISGPATEATPNTAPKMPVNFPRSRGETTSPTAACALTINPPPPSPWMARKAISSVMPCASPHSAEPTRKITSAACSTTLRPKRSPSFPYSGVTTVTASRYAVTTHEMCSRPPRSPTIVGSAVETIVWSSDASSITSIRPLMTTATRGRSAVTRARGLGDPPRPPGRLCQLAVPEPVGPADLALREAAGRTADAHRPVHDHRVALLVEGRRAQSHVRAGARGRAVEGADRVVPADDVIRGDVGAELAVLARALEQRFEPGQEALRDRDLERDLDHAEVRRLRWRSDRVHPGAV